MEPLCAKVVHSTHVSLFWEEYSGTDDRTKISENKSCFYHNENMRFADAMYLLKQIVFEYYNNLLLLLLLYVQN